jgi:3'-phosphoadenosine 5'-phosphosulfate sulfotransferase (PAPS reductase)/FAD synthetase
VATDLDEVLRLQHQHGANLAFVVNHSGGKDSTRMLGFVRRKFPDSPTYAVMADTGFEHQRPISAVMRMSPGRIRSINRAIARVQATAWSVPRKYSRQSTDASAIPANLMSAGTVKVVAVSRATAS